MKKIMFFLLGLIFLLSVNMVFAEQINAEECTSLKVNEQKPYFDVVNRVYVIGVVSASEGIAKFEIDGQITGELRAGELYTINENKHLKIESISGTTVNFCLFTYVPCVDVLDKVFENEQKTYRIGNDRYTIKAQFLGDNKVKFMINSELTNEMKAEGSYYSFGEGIPKTKIMLKEVGNVNGKNYAEYCLDSGKLIMSTEQKTTMQVPAVEINKLDLAYYPKMFFTNGLLNAVLVVGDRAPADDVVAAIDIVSSFGSLRQISPTKLASELANYNQNIISIGRPCDNAVTAQILRSNGKDYGNDCSVGLKPGQAMVRLFENNGYIHMLVFGYSKLETRQAARALSVKRMYGQEAFFNFNSGTMPQKEEDKTLELSQEEQQELAKKLSIQQMKEKCTGCIKNEACLQTGIRLLENNVPIYCDLTGELKSQKQNSVSCQNNYECSSNTCQDGICQSMSEKIESIEKELKEQRSILDKLVGFFKRLFNFN